MRALLVCPVEARRREQAPENGVIEAAHRLVLHRYVRNKRGPVRVDELQDRGAKRAGVVGLGTLDSITDLHAKGSCECGDPATSTYDAPHHKPAWLRPGFQVFLAPCVQRGAREGGNSR